MFDFLTRLFDTTDFPPRWQCGAWSLGHGWLHILSDLGVWSAYFAIPCILTAFALRRRSIPFRLVFVLFAAFILACGTTHLMEAVLFWWPAYRLLGLIKLATALVSWGTVFALLSVIPRAFAMRSPEELEREIEDRKQAETQAHNSLAQKDVLLKEVHHRVKNNLQVISSLLDLQSRHADNPATVEMFRESMNRVRSMALVHERLYRSKDLAKIDFHDYLDDLAGHLFQSYRVDPAAVRFDLQADRAIRLPIDAGVPCGLLVNELISNCLKHAFPDRVKGTVRVELRQDTGGVTLRVTDDGVGLPEAIDLETAETFGLQLVVMLVKQLKATVAVERNNGTAVRVTFPLR